MGFLDNVTSALNRGTASAKRTGRSAGLKLQLSDLMRQRRDLAAQLGASLYEPAKAIPELFEGREALFQSIEEIDGKRAEIEAEIAEIEAEAAAQRDAAMIYKCPNCGTDVSLADMFCSGCGISLAEVKAAYADQEPEPEQEAPEAPVCQACGAELAPDARFCAVCGAKREVPEAAEQVPAEAPESMQ